MWMQVWGIHNPGISITHSRQYTRGRWKLGLNRCVRNTNNCTNIFHPHMLEGHARKAERASLEWHNTLPSKLGLNLQVRHSVNSINIFRPNMLEGHVCKSERALPAWQVTGNVSITMPHLKHEIEQINKKQHMKINISNAKRFWEMNVTSTH